MKQWEILMTEIEKQLQDALGTPLDDSPDWNTVNESFTPDLDVYYHIPGELRGLWTIIGDEARLAALLVARGLVSERLHNYD